MDCFASLAMTGREYACFHIRAVPPIHRTPDRHPHATKSPDDSTMLVQRTGGGYARVAAVMREPNPYLTPARVGLIMIAVLVLGVIFARVITMSEQSEVR